MSDTQGPQLLHPSWNLSWNLILPDLCRQAHETAVEKGFWDPEPTRARSMMLLLGELSEFYEVIRKGQDSFPCEKIPNMTCAEEELADIAIRLFDFCEGHDVELHAEITPTDTSKDIEDLCMGIVRALSLFADVAGVFYYTRRLARKMGVSDQRLLWCILEKMEYNKTPPV